MKYSNRNVKILLCLLAFLIINPVNSLANGLEKIKGLWIDKDHNLVVNLEMPKNQFPDLPSMLLIPQPSKRLVIDFLNATIDEVTMPTKEELSKYFDNIFNGINQVNFTNSDTNNQSQARLVIHLAENVSVKPQVIGLDLNHVVIKLNAKLIDPDPETHESIYKDLAQNYSYRRKRYSHAKQVQNQQNADNNMFTNDTFNGAKSADLPAESRSQTNTNSNDNAVNVDKLDPMYSPKYYNDLTDLSSTKDKPKLARLEKSPVNDSPDFDWGVRPSNPNIPLDLKPQIDNKVVSENLRSENNSTNAFKQDLPESTETPKPTKNNHLFKESDPNLEYPVATKKSSITTSVCEQSITKNDNKTNLPPNNMLITNNKSAKSKALKYYNEAVKYHLKGNLNLAQKYYKETIATYPDLAEAYSNLGLIYNQKHDYVNALMQFNQAVAINPNDAITYNGIGATLRAKQDLNGAIKNWQKAIKLDPKLVIAYFNLASAYEVQKDYNKAISCYRITIEKDPQMGEAYYRLALLMERKGKLNEAKHYFKEALKVSQHGDFLEDAKLRLAYLQNKKSAN